MKQQDLTVTRSQKQLFFDQATSKNLHPLLLNDSTSRWTSMLFYFDFEFIGWISEWKEVITPSDRDIGSAILIVPIGIKSHSYRYSK